jgi:hypothetical protein
MPAGDDARKPVRFGPGEFDAIGNFDPVDLERWVVRGGPGAGKKGASGTKLVF